MSSAVRQTHRIRWRVVKVRLQLWRIPRETFWSFMKKKGQKIEQSIFRAATTPPDAAPSTIRPLRYVNLFFSLSLSHSHIFLFSFPPPWVPSAGPSVMYPLNNSLLLFLPHCDADTVALLVPLEPAPAPSNWAVKLECRGRALTRLGMYILIRSLSAAWRGGDVRAAVTFRRTQQQREPTGSVSTKKKTPWLCPKSSTHLLLHVQGVQCS